MSIEKILELVTKLKRKNLEKELLDLDISKLNKELFYTQWVLVEWNEVEKFLLDAGGSIRVTNGIDRHFYDAKIKNIPGEGDVLIVGGYYHNDNIKRGSNLYVSWELNLKPIEK